MKNKKMLIAALAVLALIAVAAYAAVHLVVLPQQDAVTLEEVLTVETTQPPETTETAQTDETAGQAEEDGMTEIFELSGEITEITGEYLMLLDKAQGEVQVNIGADTLYDGAADGELAVGQVAQILYDGKMTRSLPPQIYALRVGVYPVSGVVTEVGEDSVTLARAELGDEVIVFLSEGAPELPVGDAVTAYTGGAMTMSLPAQTTAIGIVVN